MLELLRGPAGCHTAHPRPSLHWTFPGTAHRQHLVVPARSFSFAFRGAGHEEQIRPEALQSPTASQDADREHSLRARFAALSGRIRRQPLLSPEDSEALLAAFQAPDMTRVQDILVCAALAECSYKPVDHSQAEALSLTQEILADLVPPQLISLHSVQFCKPHVRHRYMLAESDETLYVGIIGTKLRRDLVTNANALQIRIWDDNDDRDGASQEVPAAHRGFLRRADAIPIEQLFLEACRRKKRLVVCGHSLGGAVATLCVLRLLRQLPPGDNYPLQCIAFATPSIGNTALSSLVAERRWDTYISNMLLPEDVVVQLTSPSQYRAAGESGPAAAAETRPDMRRLLNPTVSMIATAATLTGLAAAAGVPATTAAAASAAAMAARARWSGSGSKSATGAVDSAESDAAQVGKLVGESLVASPSSELLQAADEALVRARRVSDSAVSQQSETARLASESTAVRPRLLQRWQRSSPSSHPAASRDDMDSRSSIGHGGNSSSGVSRTGSRYAFKFPWAAGGSGSSQSCGAGQADARDHALALDCVGGDHTADGRLRSPNPGAPDPAQLLSLSVQQRPRDGKRSRPGSLVVQPAVRAKRPGSAPAVGGAQPGTVLVHGHRATASDPAAAPAQPPTAAEKAPAGWHWGPPDPMKAAAWAGARRAVRFASLPASAAKAAQIVSYPVRKAMSVARAYVPLSNSQMYVLPTRVTANAQDLATAAAQTPANGTQAAVGDGALREASQEQDVSGATASLDRQEAEELSAAEAQREGKGQRRSFFLMHRMASYRARLKNIWQTAVGAERVAAWQAAATPPALVLTNTLSPQMTSLQAGGTLPTPTLPGPEQLVRLFPADAAATKRQRQLGVAGDAPTTTASGEHRWCAANPLAWLGRRAAGARPAAVDVDITVLGCGLEHCTGVRITVNDTGATCPLRITRQPQVTFDAQVWPPPLDRRENLGRVMEVVPHFFARVQQAANAVIRNRPDTALLDSMTIRARIPAAVAASCSVVSSNPLLQLGRDAPSGTGQLMTIQLQSDFQTAKLPLDLCASDGEALVSRLLQQLNAEK